MPSVSSSRAPQLAAAYAARAIDVPMRDADALRGLAERLLVPLNAAGDQDPRTRRTLVEPTITS